MMALHKTPEVHLLRFAPAARPEAGQQKRGRLGQDKLACGDVSVLRTHADHAAERFKAADRPQQIALQNDFQPLVRTGVRTVTEAAPLRRKRRFQPRMRGHVFPRHLRLHKRERGAIPIAVTAEIPESEQFRPPVQQKFQPVKFNSLHMAHLLCRFAADRRRPFCFALIPRRGR